MSNNSNKLIRSNIFQPDDIARMSHEFIADLLNEVADKFEWLSKIQMPDKPVAGEHFAEYTIGAHCAMADLMFQKLKRLNEKL